MLALLQRVTKARVTVDDHTIATIDAGILALVGFHREDTSEDIQRMCMRLLNYRLFGDSKNRMNLSLLDTGGGLLLVPQFTLAADTNRGLRASFSSAAPPDEAKLLFMELLSECRDQHKEVAAGQFGSDMHVHLVNDGPVSFVLSS